MKITLIAGSNRANATSTNLLRYIESLLKEMQISVSFVDLAKLQLPLFSADSWDFHPNAQRLLEEVKSGDALVLATPEYHGSISGALKNALDYINAEHVSGKAVLSVSSAGGPIGVSSLTHLQTIIRNLHGINCSDWISIGYGTNSFESDGVPSDEGTRHRVRDVVNNFVDLTRKLAATTTTAI
jgi:NAD(P)H-dependent FMN reductase